MLVLAKKKSVMPANLWLFYDPINSSGSFALLQSFVSEYLESNSLCFSDSNGGFGAPVTCTATQSWVQDRWVPFLPFLKSPIIPLSQIWSHRGRCDKYGRTPAQVEVLSGRRLLNLSLLPSTICPPWWAMSASTTSGTANATAALNNFVCRGCRRFLFYTSAQCTVQTTTTTATAANPL